MPSARARAKPILVAAPGHRDSLAIASLRKLCRDSAAVALAGHTGTMQTLAPAAYVLWQRFLKFDPQDAIWPNRDRLIFSAGHVSLLHYSLLHLAGVRSPGSRYEKAGEPAVSMDDLKKFRKPDSRCQASPEYRWTAGIECTTGPLGQGVATSVGMAMAERWLASYFNRPGFELFDYDTYAFCGDGCLMEGVTAEAASLAGHLRLSNLCWIYDNNRASFEGPTSLAFSDDVASRFMGYGWSVQRVGNVNDLDRLERAFAIFMETRDRPTLIILDSHLITALGEGEEAEPIAPSIASVTSQKSEPFELDPSVRQHFEETSGRRSRQERDLWVQKFRDYEKAFPELAQQLYQLQRRQLPEGWDRDLPRFTPDAKGLSGREASSRVLNAIARKVPWLLGGSADVAPSTKAVLDAEDAGDFCAESYEGRRMHFGVRESAMASALNGLALAKIRPFGAGLLSFSDHSRTGLRMAALMEVPVIHIFTHDSVSMGDDGPSCQPLDHLPALRTIPGLLVIRPGDANEVVEAWRLIMKLHHEPVALVLSRRYVATLDRSKYGRASELERGAYILAESKGGDPEAIIIGTGSELPVCVQAYESLSADGVKVRLVSMPSWELFERQTGEYRSRVLPPEVLARVAVEQGSCFGWERYIGMNGKIIGLPMTGAAPPLRELSRKQPTTAERIVEAVKSLLLGRAEVERS